MNLQNQDINTHADSMIAAAIRERFAAARALGKRTKEAAEHLSLRDRKSVV